MREMNLKSKSSERTCVIRLRDGRRLDLRGADVPSTNAVLLLFKNRREKRAGNKNRLAAKRRDLKRREEALRQ